MLFPSTTKASIYILSFWHRLRCSTMIWTGEPHHCLNYEWTVTQLRTMSKSQTRFDYIKRAAKNSTPICTFKPTRKLNVSISVTNYPIKWQFVSSLFSRALPELQQSQLKRSVNRTQLVGAILFNSSPIRCNCDVGERCLRTMHSQPCSSFQFVGRPCV